MVAMVAMVIAYLACSIYTCKTMKVSSIAMCVQVQVLIDSTTLLFVSLILALHRSKVR